MVNKPKAIGTAGETAVVRYLNANGFGGAERPALHGTLDEGDITGCPGLGFEVKAGHAAETASDAQIAAWLVEAEVERVNRSADLCPLVLKRKGKGAASAGQWWAYLPSWALVHLANSAATQRWAYLPSWALVHLANSAATQWWAYQPIETTSRVFADLPAVRVTLAELVTLLRRAGYGDPLTSREDLPA